MHTPLSILLEQKGRYFISVPSDTSIFDCVAKMNSEKIGALLVIDNDKLVGIFTERDVLTRVATKELNVREMPVSDVMTTHVATLSPEDTVRDAMRVITEKRFRHIPVAKDGAIQGVVSSGDLTRWIVSSQEREIEDLVKYINQDIVPPTDSSSS